MKKLYETPTAKLTGLSATEDLAISIEFDDLVNMNVGPGTSVTPSDEDINIFE